MAAHATCRSTALDDALGLGGRHREEGEALEHEHVAHRLAVEAGGAR